MTLFYDRSFLTIFPMLIFEINTEDVYIFLTNHKYQFDQVFIVSFFKKLVKLPYLLKSVPTLIQGPKDPFSTQHFQRFLGHVLKLQNENATMRKKALSASYFS